MIYNTQDHGNALYHLRFGKVHCIKFIKCDIDGIHTNNKYYSHSHLNCSSTNNIKMTNNYQKKAYRRNRSSVSLNKLKTASSYSRGNVESGFDHLVFCGDTSVEFSKCPSV